MTFYFLIIFECKFLIEIVELELKILIKSSINLNKRSHLHKTGRIATPNDLGVGVSCKVLDA